MSILDSNNYNGKKYRIKHRIKKILIIIIIMSLFVFSGKTVLSKRFIDIRLYDFRDRELLNPIKVEINPNETKIIDLYAINKSPFDVKLVINGECESKQNNTLMWKDVKYPLKIEIENNLNYTRLFVISIEGKKIG